MSELLRVGPSSTERVQAIVLAERELALGAGWVRLVATQERGHVSVVLSLATSAHGEPVQLDVVPIRDLLALATMCERVAHAAGAPR